MAAGAYAGQDRRGSAAPHAELDGRGFLLAGGLLIGLLLGVVLVESLAPVESWMAVGPVGAMLSAASAVLGTLLGVLLLLRFRLTGDAVALWVGAAAIVVAVVMVGFGELLPLSDATVVDTAVLAWVRPAGLMVALALLVAALRSPEVDARLSIRSVLAGAAGAVAGLALLLQLVPAVSRLVVGSTEPLPSVATSMAGTAITAAAWIVLAAVLLVRAIRGRRLLYGYAGLLTWALAMAEIARGIQLEGGGTWILGEPLLRSVGLALALVGAVQELQLGFAAQSTRMLQSHLRARQRQEELEAERAQRARLAHEARNALSAIEGATVTLDRSREALSPEQRGRLTVAVTKEIARLQQLVSAEHAAAEPQPLDVGAVVQEQVELARARGSNVFADLPDELTAVAEPTAVAEALQNLLVNAERHAADTPVVVRGQHDGEQVMVRVEDRGPGVASSDLDRIFDHGVRAGHGHGSGLGLYVSRKLAREQGGDLWAEARSGAGAAFVLALPSEQVVDQPVEGGQTPDAGGAPIAVALHDRVAGHSVREVHDDIGTDPVR